MLSSEFVNHKFKTPIQHQYLFCKEVAKFLKANTSTPLFSGATSIHDFLNTTKEDWTDRELIDYQALLINVLGKIVPKFCGIRIEPEGDQYFLFFREISKDPEVIITEQSLRFKVLNETIKLDELLKLIKLVDFKKEASIELILINDILKGLSIELINEFELPEEFNYRSLGENLIDLNSDTEI